MTQNAESEKRTTPGGEASANEFDRPLPGSDGAVPDPTASGVAEPIEETEKASGVDPGNPTPTRRTETKNPN